MGEFRVVTNNLSAEYGNRMGGQVFVNIKSGTNQFHGTAFEFLRNSNLDGTNFFANRAEQEAGLQAEPVWRHGGRPDPEGQDVFLWVV
ncbi:MAG: hypothetical protein IPJ98_24490 [Bryobacterales bacterium]|nr:hypothetical protein [Bryobacterales bacterium]